MAPEPDVRCFGNHTCYGKRIERRFVLAYTPTRRNRIVLLLGSLLDATTVDQSDGSSSGKPSSRILAPSVLYRRGSYAELDKCMDALRRHAPKVHWHTWRIYVEQHPVTDKGKHLSSRKALRGLGFLEAAMPRYVMVPTELLENAGYNVSSVARERQAA